MYVSRDDVLKEYGTRRITYELKRRVLIVLKAEVEEYGRWLNGEVYGYRIEDAEGAEIDACWGFVGLDYVRSEVNGILDNLPHTLPLPEQVA